MSSEIILERTTVGATFSVHEFELRIEPGDGDSELVRPVRNDCTLFFFFFLGELKPKTVTFGRNPARKKRPKRTSYNGRRSRKTPSNKPEPAPAWHRTWTHRRFDSRVYRPVSLHDFKTTTSRIV